MSVLARLDRLPMSRPHYMLLIIGGLGFAFDGMDNALLAFLLPSISAVWGLGNTALGFLAAATPLGYLVGAAVAGIVGDRIGRKVVMLWALAVYTLATLVAAAAGGFEMFAAARIVAGLGIGAESVIIAPYLAEFVPPAKRGWFVGTLAAFFSFGYVAASLLGRVVVPLGVNGWRWAQVITALPILALLWWRRSLDESPRYLLIRGREDEAAEVVARLEKRVEAAGHRLDPVPTTSTYPRLEPTRPGIGAAVGHLLSRGLRRRTIVVFTVWFVNVFAFYGFFTWIPTLLVQRGIEVTRSFDFSIIIYTAMLPGFYSAAWLSERLDRKNTIALYYVGATASALWLSQSSEPVTILFAGAVLSFFLNGAIGATYAYTPELFATWVRASATGYASAFGRIGSITAPIIIGYCSVSWGFAGVFGLTSAVLAVGVLVVVLMGVRTRGASLEELNEGADPAAMRARARPSEGSVPSSAPERSHHERR